MTKQPLPPITKIAERLLCDIEQAVRGFARYHKYSLGSDLRAQAMTVVRTCHRAWRERARQAQWINELVWAIDELKLSLQLGSQLHAADSITAWMAIRSPFQFIATGGMYELRPERRQCVYGYRTWHEQPMPMRLSR